MRVILFVFVCVALSLAHDVTLPDFNDLAKSLPDLTKIRELLEKDALTPEDLLALKGLKEEIQVGAENVAAAYEKFMGDVKTEVEKGEALVKFYQQQIQEAANKGDSFIAALGLSNLRQVKIANDLIELKGSIAEFQTKVANAIKQFGDLADTYATAVAAASVLGLPPAQIDLLLKAKDAALSALNLKKVEWSDFEKQLKDLWEKVTTKVEELKKAGEDLKEDINKIRDSVKKTVAEIKEELKTRREEFVAEVKSQIKDVHAAFEEIKEAVVDFVEGSPDNLKLEIVASVLIENLTPEQKEKLVEDLKSLIKAYVLTRLGTDVQNIVIKATEQASVKRAGVTSSFIFNIDISQVVKVVDWINSNGVSLTQEQRNQLATAANFFALQLKDQIAGFTDEQLQKKIDEYKSQLAALLTQLDTDKADLAKRLLDREAVRDSDLKKLDELLSKIFDSKDQLQVQLEASVQHFLEKLKSDKEDLEVSIASLKTKFTEASAYVIGALEELHSLVKQWRAETDAAKKAALEAQFTAKLQDVIPEAQKRFVELKQQYDEIVKSYQEKVKQYQEEVKVAQDKIKNFIQEKFENVEEAKKRWANDLEGLKKRFAERISSALQNLQVVNVDVKDGKVTFSLNVELGTLTTAEVEEKLRKLIELAVLSEAPVNPEKVKIELTKSSQKRAVSYSATATLESDVMLGAIIGGVIGGLVLIAIIVVAVIVIRKRNANESV